MRSQTCAMLFGTTEILILLIAVLIFWSVANFGKNTSLGFWGSLLLAIFTTPVIAFFIILIFFRKR